MFKEKQNDAAFGSSHTHILNDMVEPATKLLPNQPGEGGRGRVVK